MAGIKKILIVRLSSFGDIILTFPLINILKNKFPQSHISFVVKDKYADLVKLNPKVDEVINYYTDGGEDLKTALKSAGYEVVLDLQNNPRSRILTNGLKNVYRFEKDNFKKFLLVRFKINKLKDAEPVYKRYIRTASEAFGIGEGEMMFTPSEISTDTGKKPDSNYVVVAPSSRHFTKTYPKEKFVEYIKSNPDTNYLLVGDDSEEDKEICSTIENETNNTINLCGQLSYAELAGIIGGSDHVICNDSGILHLSEAMGKRVVAIFGSTVKEFGFFPQLKESLVYEIEGLKCRPCSHIGLPSCPLGHFKCMNEIELE